MTRFTLRDMLLAVTFFAIGLACSAWYAQSIRAKGLKAEAYCRNLEEYTNHLEGELKESQEKSLRLVSKIVDWAQSGKIHHEALRDFVEEQSSGVTCELKIEVRRPRRDK